MMLNFACFLSKPSCFMLLCFLPCKAHSPVQLADIWSPPKAISLHGLVCVSHTQNPQDSLIFLPYYVIVLCYLFRGPPYCGLYSHYSSQSALTKTQNDLWFAKSNALPLELSLFDTTVVFDTVLCPGLGALPVLQGCRIPIPSSFSSSSLTSPSR